MGPRLVRRGKDVVADVADVIEQVLQWGLVLLDEESPV